MASDSDPKAMLFSSSTTADMSVLPISLPKIVASSHRSVNSGALDSRQRQAAASIKYRTQGKETKVPKLRHIAVTVPNLEEAASFYEKTFGMIRATESDIAILLTDGVVSLAILKFKTDEQAGDERGKNFHGLHHMGFVVEDIEGMQGTIEGNGGSYHMQLPDTPEGASEIKFRDPNGVVFDIVTAQYAEKAWRSES